MPLTPTPTGSSAPIDVLLKRALAAYFRQDGELVHDQVLASTLLLHDGKVYVVLSTPDRVRALYRLEKDGVLRRLWKVPSGLDLCKVDDRRSGSSRPD